MFFMEVLNMTLFENYMERDFALPPQVKFLHQAHFN